MLTTGRSDLAEGALDVVLEGRAEQVTSDPELEPVATPFAVKYPTGPWDFVVIVNDMTLFLSLRHPGRAGPVHATARTASIRARIDSA